MHRVFALIVGIDAYPPPSKALAGCVNDARTFEAMLRRRIGVDNLYVEALLDAAATRGSILSSFRRHLGRCERGDSALFFFAGHGSQERPPTLYASSEPDQKSETLVAFDSRQADGWDIADKEMAVLVAEVAAAGAHVIVVLDCCHSGSATRNGDDGVRRALSRHRRRPAATYWFFGADDAPRHLDRHGGWRSLPAAPHVLLTACQDFELARERTMADGRRHGIFSFLLVESLGRVPADVSYRDLHRLVQAEVQRLNPKQLPQASGELDRRVLDGAFMEPRRHFHVGRRAGRWVLDAGAAHGLVVDSELDVLPSAEASPEIRDRDPIATVRAHRVGPLESEVEVIRGGLPFGRELFTAILRRRPDAGSIPVWAESSALAELELRRSVEASPWLEWAESLATAKIRVELGAVGLVLGTRLHHGRLSVPARPGALRECLERMARWHLLLSQAQPADGAAESAMEMRVFKWKGPPDEEGPEPTVEALEEPEVRLPYDGVGRRAKPARFTVRLRNRSHRWLYFALLDLDDNFAVHSLRGGSGRLKPGHHVWIRAGDGIPASVPDDLHALGITLRRDFLLLMVSERAADWSLFEQPRLDAVWEGRASRRGISVGPRPAGALRGPAARRELDGSFSMGVHRHFSAERRVIIAHRPAVRRRLAGSSNDALLVSGVRARVEDGVRVDLQLFSLEDASRFGMLPAERLLEESVRPVSLTPALASDEGLAALCVTYVVGRGPASEAPLTVELERVAGGTGLLAVARCGKSCVLAGVSGETPGSCRITHCPPHTPSASSGEVVTSWLFFFEPPGSEDWLSLLGEDV